MLFKHKRPKLKPLNSEAMLFQLKLTFINHINAHFISVAKKMSLLLI